MVKGKPNNNDFGPEDSSNNNVPRQTTKAIDDESSLVV
jgi:hypothetical protein